MLEKKIKINISKYPKLIIDTLKEKGYDAYIVGGCVRDSLLNKEPSDYDITTSAKPEDIKKMFKKTIDTGIKHGTVTVLYYDKDGPHTYEVTTYRVDGIYKDGRHPEDVKFVDDLKEDLRRRDFTVNAMAYNDEKGLIDEFDGIGDLNNKIIRAVGNPYERFNEDGLRLLRAIRFAAKLGFEIESNTKNAIPIVSKNLSLVSKERIQIELTKILTSANPWYVKKIFDLGLAKYICDGFENINIGKFEKELKIHIAYACLLYNEDESFAYKILRELKLDNSTISKVVLFLQNKKLFEEIKKNYNNKNDIIESEYGYYKNVKSYSCKKIEVLIKQLLESLGYDLYDDFLKFISINSIDSNSIKFIKGKLEYYKNSDVPIFIRDLEIDGNIVKNIGFDGREVGYVLMKLKELVHKYPDFNKKKLLQEIAGIAYNIVSQKTRGDYGL